MGRNLLFFSSLALNLLEVDSLKLRLDSVLTLKRASCTPAGFKNLLERKFYQCFANSKLDNYRKCNIYFWQTVKFSTRLIYVATILTIECFA